ncbi:MULTISPECIES: ABC transporter permease subunit [unclassified Fusibacter]|uniref:ABC transporter permease subunit n=1 Tax=unclassified Fusibacter TaxID=2624464 RepID=UPI0010119A76|nr:MULTISPECIES: ABC transporter permease subunit [unclassified Fusibacter]MCK8058683.1 ABC transporter permease [Fusibacter sp. A2]NPE21758.1 ABC transporter permease subunit [Fusibacter sp. A1]RXV61332.1 ABC transporter [Fusibacter sp. A1]
MNILIRELKANLKSMLIWSGSMAALIYMGMIKYSAFEKTGAAVNEFFEQLPKPILKILGVIGGTDLTSVAVFYSIFFLYFLLLAAVHATMLGTLIIAKEERDKTADFLFVKPVKRSRVILFKVVAAMINITFLNLVTFVFSLISTAPYTKGVSITNSIFFIIIGLYVLQIMFLGIGLFLGGVVKRSKVATSIGSGIILSTFLLKVIIDLKRNIDYLDYFTPFRYFKPSDLMFKHSIDGLFVVIALISAVVSVTCAFYFFKKRDLSS